MTLKAGTRLGAYEVIAALGAGGMGEVYRARHLTLTSVKRLASAPTSTEFSLVGG